MFKFPVFQFWGLIVHVGLKVESESSFLTSETAVDKIISSQEWTLNLYILIYLFFNICPTLVWPQSHPTSLGWTGMQTSGQVLSQYQCWTFLMLLWLNCCKSLQPDSLIESLKPYEWKLLSCQYASSQVLAEWSNSFRNPFLPHLSVGPLL